MVDKNILVLVEEDQIKNIERVTGELIKAGLKLTNSMESVGIISGTAKHELVKEFIKIDGVSDVREEKTISHPPLDKDTPQ